MYKYPHFLSLSFLAFGIPYNDTKAGGNDLYEMRFGHNIVIRAQVGYDKSPFNLHLDLSSSCISPPFPSNDVKWKETRRRKEKKESGYKMKEVRRGSTWWGTEGWIKKGSWEQKNISFSLARKRKESFLQGKKAPPHAISEGSFLRGQEQQIQLAAMVYPARKSLAFRRCLSK